MKHATLAPTLFAIAAASLLTLTGCGSSAVRSVSLDTWQQNVSQYVKERGDGDPTVLRDVTLADGRKGYAMLGNPVVKDSTDAVGLLVGVPQLNGRPAFVYLVGMDKAGKVEDIRLVAVTIDGHGLHWHIGHPNPAAVQTYLKYREREWRAREPQRKEPPLLAENFPAPDDVFTLTVEPTRLTAVHQATKADWTVSLTGGRQ
jgi:hypothetical protein